MTAPAIARRGRVWAPQAGGQLLFVTSPYRETLFTGTRGAAKTDALLMDFAQHVGKGYGAAWRGVLFRRTYPQLADVVARSRRWFSEVFPQARFNTSTYTWHWPTGEELLLRHFDGPQDYWNYHGHEYPWIAWEELTAWPTLEGYHLMKSCNRCSVPGVPLKYRATMNAWGVGHNQVKAYIVDPGPAGTPIKGEANTGLVGLVDPALLEQLKEILANTGETWTRVRVRGHWRENRALLAADPNYPVTVLAAAGGNPMIARAWLNEDWDIVAGGMFDDVWDRKRHAITPFPIPPGWTIRRAFDWGSAKPFSVGWWARSDGSPARLRDGTLRHFPKGSRFRIAEWYGWNGQPNQGSRLSDSEIARGILYRERLIGIAGRVTPGPADPSIFDIVNADSPAAMHARMGVRWAKAIKGPDSRKRGWELLRRMLKAAVAPRLEEPGLWVFDTCLQWIRTVPTLPRDETKHDDVDTEAEDHAADETRYELQTPQITTSTGALPR